MLSVDFSDITIVTAKGFDYRCTVSDISKFDAIQLICYKIQHLMMWIYTKCNSKESMLRTSV